MRHMPTEQRYQGNEGSTNALDTHDGDDYACGDDDDGESVMVTVMVMLIVMVMSGW